MSEPALTIPDWTLGWRLQRALDWAGLSQQEMAAELDVSRGTISRWCNDHGAPPRSIYLRTWAARCRVPLDWLRGEPITLPRVDSNHQPAGLRPDNGANVTSRAEILAFRKAIRHGQKVTSR